MSLRAPWTTRSRIVGIERTRTLVPPSFGMAFCRNRIGRYVRVTSSSCICARTGSPPLASDVLKRYPVNPWGAVVGLGHPIRFPEGLHCADMDIQAPEP